jgi:hypothetical protein
VARALRDDELRRVEAARVALERSARATRLIAFGVPGVVAPLMTVMLVLNRQAESGGDWIGLLLSLLAVCGVFTLPMLLGREGRALSCYRGLCRDAANGFVVETATGEVTWGARQHAFVAMAGSRALASPFFTQYESLPQFWSRFDRLRPGYYEFELLPNSGLVVTARPAADARSRLSADAARPYRALPKIRSAEDPADAALSAAFRNSPAEQAANRAGRASGRQRWRLLVGAWWMFMVLPLLAFSAVASVKLASAGHPLKGSLSTLVSVVLLGAAVQALWRILRDVAGGKIDCVEGRIHLSFAGKTGDATGSIHGVTFDVDAAQVAALRENEAYAVYVFHHSRRAVAAHVDDLAPPDSGSGAGLPRAS